nr:hypothetical protein [Neobacillus sp. Marseille-Q6967]
MSFIKGMKDKTDGERPEISFIKGMKDKTRWRMARDVLHQGDEGQNPMENG